MMDGTLICPACGAQYPEDDVVWRCRCGSYLDLKEMFRPDPEKFTGTHFLHRYSSVLPLRDPKNAVSFGEYATPLHPMTFYGIPVKVKMDYLLATGSFKDRGAAVMVNKCRELGISRIVEDSSGNSASAVAAYSALAGIHAHIFMPAGNSSAKTIQVSTYGATLHKIPGNRTDCAMAAKEAAAESYYAAHTWNPYFLHGTKTVIYEIMEQMNWTPPGYIIIPVGSGTQFLGIWLGLKEMKHAGLIKTYPRLVAVQSEHCTPLKNFAQGKITPELPKTPILAEGIAIRHPARLSQILQALKETAGETVTVTDRDIVEGLQMAAKQGLYIEPTSAAAIAALKQYSNRLTSADRAVVSLTGHGLKASARIQQIIGLQ